MGVVRHGPENESLCHTTGRAFLSTRKRSDALGDVHCHFTF